MQVPPIVFFLLIVTFAAQAQQNIGAGVSKADDAYRVGMQKLRSEYRKAFADAISSTTKIEVYLLDFESTNVRGVKDDLTWVAGLAEDQFPIVPYRGQSKILKRKMLSADEIRLLMPSLQKTIAVEDDMGGVLCHFPIHGIRVWDGDDIVFQTSICHHCGNFYMTYPYGVVRWTSLSNSEFGDVLEQLMPIPQKEVDRFERTYGVKKKELQK